MVKPEAINATLKAMNFDSVQQEIATWMNRTSVAWIAYAVVL